MAVIRNRDGLISNDKFGIITTVSLSNGITSIGSYAFYYCWSLTSITIPESVTSIGDDAFYSCWSLTSITIPDGVTSISDYAFYGCSSLTSVIIPDGVTSIGSSAFSGCSSLTSITIPDGVTSIGSSAFYYCSSLTSVIIPDGVTSIGSYAFYGCSSLTSVISLATTPPSCLSETFSSDTYEQATLYAASTSYAWHWVWYNFQNIVYISIGSCGDDLEWYYSDGRLIIFGTGDMQSYSSADEVPWAGLASEITSITIGSGVTSISDYAFSNCTNITSVTSYNTTAPTLSENTFDSSTYSSASLSVTSTNYVLAAYWKLFYTKTIVDASTEEDYTDYNFLTNSGTAISYAVVAQSAIRTSGNQIVIVSSSDQIVAIFSLGGQIIIKQEIAAGTTKIAMPHSGIYIAVLSDGTKAKVLVK